jgi:lipopolysaccharide biosynthesis glycosyltransferase
MPYSLDIGFTEWRNPKASFNLPDQQIPMRGPLPHPLDIASDRTKAIAFSCDERFLVPAVANAVRAARLCPDADVIVFFNGRETSIKPWPLPDNLHIAANAINPALFAGFTTTEVLPVASLMRMLMPFALPARVDRMLYLDCDMAIRSDFTDIWKVDLEDATVAACDDLHGLRFGPDGERLQSFMAVDIGLPGADYLNTGLLLVDVGRYQALDILGMAAAAHATMSGSYVFADQDLLNHMFAGRLGILSPRFNFMNTLSLTGFDALFPISILHNTSWPKPWEASWSHPDPAHRRYFEAAFAAIGEQISPLQVRRVRRSELLREAVLNLGLRPSRRRDLLAPLIEAQAGFLTLLKQGVKSRRWLDVRQGVTEIDPATVARGAPTQLRYKGHRPIFSDARPMAPIE